MPSPQNRSADLFGFAISFKFRFVRALTDVSKEKSRSRSRDQMGLVRRDRGIQEVVGVARDDLKLRNVGLRSEEKCIITYRKRKLDLTFF